MGQRLDLNTAIAMAGKALAMIDINAFKKRNDPYGHLIGDQILKFLGALLTREIKGNATFAVPMEVWDW